MALNMNAAVKIQASVDGIASINGLEKSLNRVDKEVTGLSGAFQRLGNAGKTVGGVLASIGIGALANTFATAGIDAERTNKRIANLAGPLKETTSLMKFATQAAKTYGIGQTQAKNAVADLYARLRPTGTSLEKIKTAFIGVNNAAAAMNLTTGQTDNVMLQLSQALGSGKLQGDEFRSVMEQLPSIGQAVADVLGTNVAGLKQMSSEGKITSDVLLEALAKLSQQKPPPPDAYKKFQAALADLQTEIGTKLLPALTPLVQFASQLLSSFSALPAPLQTLIVAIGSLAAAFVVLAPAINAIISIFTTLGGLFAGGGVFATIAGSLGALGPVVAAIGSALSGLGTILVGIFTGPVGWAALLIAAGVAIYAFRDQIGQAFGAIGQLISQAFTGLMELIKTVFVQPMIDLWNNVLREPITGFFEFVKSVFDWGFKAIYAIAWQIFVQPYINLWNNVLREPVTAMFNWATTTFDTAFKGLISLLNTVFIQPWVNLWNNVLRTPVTAAVTWLQGIWTGITKFFNEKVIAPIRTAWTALTEFLPKAMQNLAQNVQNIWNNVVNTIKNAIRGILRFIANALNGIASNVNALIRTFNRLPGPDIPYVPTLNVPQFAEGGVVNRPTLAMIGEGGQPEYIVPQSKAANFASNYLGGMRGNAAIQSQSNNSSASPTIQIQTGPVLQQNNQQYVTIADMEKALTTLTDSLLLNNRTFGGRSYQGVGA